MGEVNKCHFSRAVANLGGQTFKKDRKAETVESRWLITQDMD